MRVIAAACSDDGELYRIDIRTGRKERWNNILPKDLLVNDRLATIG